MLAQSVEHFDVKYGGKSLGQSLTFIIIKLINYNKYNYFNESSSYETH